MAAQSYVSANFVRELLTNSIDVSGFDLDADTIRLALFKDTVSGQDKSADEEYGLGAYAAANEITPNNDYNAGGWSTTNQSLSNVSVSVNGTTGLLVITCDPMIYTSLQITSGNEAVGGLIYNASRGNKVIAWNLFPDPVVLPTAGEYEWIPDPNYGFAYGTF